MQAIVAVVLALGVGVATVLGEVAVTAAAVVLVLLLAYGWPVLLRIPSPNSASVSIAIAGLAAVFAPLYTGGTAPLAWIPAIVGLSLLLAFLRELVRRDGRERLVESVTAQVAGMVVVGSAVGWITVLDATTLTQLPPTSAGLLAVALLTTAIPGLRTPVRVVVTVGGTLLVGVAIGYFSAELNYRLSLVLAAVIALVVLAMHALLASLMAKADWRGRLAAITAPVAAGGISVMCVAMLATALIA